MTKAELVVALQKKADLSSKTKSEEILKAFLDTVTEALASGDAVTLSGLGSFKVVSRAARMGRNPRTGNTIEIPASKNIKFTPAKALKEAL